MTHKLEKRSIIGMLRHMAKLWQQKHVVKVLSKISDEKNDKAFKEGGVNYDEALVHEGELMYTLCKRKAKDIKRERVEEEDEKDSKTIKKYRRVIKACITNGFILDLGPKDRRQPLDRFHFDSRRYLEVTDKGIDLFHFLGLSDAFFNKYDATKQVLMGGGAVAIIWVITSIISAFK